MSFPIFKCFLIFYRNIPKIHEQLHVAENIELYGAHRNVHTGPQEHNHIQNVKHPARGRQKRKALFDLQISDWLVDKLIIDYTHTSILNHQYDCNMHEYPNTARANYESTHYAAKFAVHVALNQETENIELEYHWITASQKNKGQDESLLKWIVNLFFKPLSVKQQLKGVNLCCYTEYNRQGVTFRCHPNYKSEGAWYDYVLVAWDNPNNELYSNSKKNVSLDCNEDFLDVPVITQEKETTSNVLLIPAKLICFVQDDNNNFFAVIHSCHEYFVKMSVLTYRWQLEYEGNKVVKQKIHPHECGVDASTLTPIYHAVSVDTIQKHCLMIPYDNESQSQFLMQVIVQHKWAHSFA